MELVQKMLKGEIDDAIVGNSRDCLKVVRTQTMLNNMRWKTVVVDRDSNTMLIPSTVSADWLKPDKNIAKRHVFSKIINLCDATMVANLKNWQSSAKTHSDVLSLFWVCRLWILGLVVFYFIGVILCIFKFVDYMNNGLSFYRHVYVYF